MHDCHACLYCEEGEADQEQLEWCNKERDATQVFARGSHHAPSFMDSPHSHHAHCWQTALTAKRSAETQLNSAIEVL
eukprot:4052868-Amphidinium_carterae.2